MASDVSVPTTATVIEIPVPTSSVPLISTDDSLEQDNGSSVTTTIADIATKPSGPKRADSSVASSSSGSISPPTVIGTSIPIYQLDNGRTVTMDGVENGLCPACVVPIQALGSRSLDQPFAVGEERTKLTRMGQTLPALPTLPTLSVSEPSPPHDKVECL